MEHQESGSPEPLLPMETMERGPGEDATGNNFIVIQVFMLFLFVSFLKSEQHRKVQRIPIPGKPAVDRCEINGYVLIDHIYNQICS